MSERKVGPSSDRPPVRSAWMARWGNGPGCSSSASGEGGGGGVSSREVEGYKEGSRVIEFMGGKGGLGELRSRKIGTLSGGIGNVGDSREEMLPPLLALAPPGGAGSGSDRGEREIDRPVVGSSSYRAVVQSIRGEENIEFVGGGGVFQRMLSHSGVRSVPRETRHVGRRGLFEEFYGRSCALPRMASSVCDMEITRMCKTIDTVAEPASCPPRESMHVEGRGLFEEFYGRSRALPRTASSLREMETMQIYKTMDSAAEPTGCPPRFSQTTHHFLIRKKGDDVDMARGDEMTRQSTVSSKKAVRELITLPPDFTFPGRKGLTLESLDDSTEIEEKGNCDTVKTSGVGSLNESSAKTYTIYKDAFGANHRSGIASPSLNKDVKEDEQTRQTSHSLGTSLRGKSQGRMPTSELPDINKPAPPDLAAEAGDNEASTSGTQSLGVDCFVPNANRSMKRSGSGRDGALVSDPCIRWVKRLKPSSSGPFAHGTKISIMEETSLHRKVSKFRKILGCSKNSSEAVCNKVYDREMTVMNQTGVSTADSKPQPSAKESQDVKLSHAWIQRWCHNSAALLGKKHGSLIFSEQQGSKAADYDGKQFPSIAAMALMGKAMNGLPQCKLRKSGSLSIWKSVGY